MILNMKRLVSAFLLLSIFLLSGCATGSKKYKRISFESNSLGEEKRIDQNTPVENSATEKFASQIATYEISERPISDQECRQMMENLGFPDDPDTYEIDGNRLYIDLADYYERPSRGYFDMTEEALEKLAWEEFNKIPFIEGEYEYAGIKGEQTIESTEGKYIERVLVAFYPVLDGVRVIGDNRCHLWFDGSGLVEINIRMYSFEKIGIMDMVPLTEAEARINTPDEFSLDKTGSVDSLCVDHVKLFLVNQCRRGCEILQPMYTFYGTAQMEDDEQEEFKSSVIAIPEELTYEE